MSWPLNAILKVSELSEQNCKSYNNFKMAVGAEEGRVSSKFTNFDDQADFLGLSIQIEFVLD